MAGRIGFELDFGGPGGGRDRRALGGQNRILVLGAPIAPIQLNTPFCGSTARFWT